MLLYNKVHLFLSLMTIFLQCCLALVLPPLPIISLPSSGASQGASMLVATQTKFETIQTATQSPESPPMTTIPPLLVELEPRQKCWNDQGFSVDCATWTGYYYTWGPPGNPYEGGPGEGGGGSGSGGGTYTLISNSESRLVPGTFLPYVIFSSLLLIVL